MCDIKKEDTTSSNNPFEKKKYRIVIAGDQIKIVDIETGEVCEIIHAVKGKLRGEEKNDKYLGKIIIEECSFFITFNQASVGTGNTQVNFYCNKCFSLLSEHEVLNAFYEHALEEYVLEYQTSENEFEFSFQITEG